MHPVLRNSQGLTIERPARSTGTILGAAVSTVALSLALALLAKSADWPISFPQFLAYLGAGTLLIIAALFAFWAWGCLTLRYVLDRSGITIVWGPIKHYIAVDRIQALVHGRAEQRPQVKGLGWWGYHIGRGFVEGLGQVLFFSTHKSAEDLIYVRTSTHTYALSPRDPVRFIAEAQRFQQAGKPEQKPELQRDLLAAHPIWADRTAQALALAAVLLNVVLWGFLFAVYPSLSNEITIEFPPLGEITTLQSRAEILKIPAAASGILGVNLLAGLALQYQERAGIYLLLSAAVFFQVLFWVAAAVALVNA